MEEMEEIVQPGCVPGNMPVNTVKVPANVAAKVPANVPAKVPVAGAAGNSSGNSPGNSPGNSSANSAAKKGPSRSKRIKRIKLGNRTFVSIRTYRKDPRVNIRDYMSDVNGDRHAMKRGILLTSAQWTALKDNMDDIDEGLKKRRVQ